MFSSGFLTIICCVLCYKIEPVINAGFSWSTNVCSVLVFWFFMPGACCNWKRRLLQNLPTTQLALTEAVLKALDIRQSLCLRLDPLIKLAVPRFNSVTTHALRLGFTHTANPKKLVGRIANCFAISASSHLKSGLRPAYPPKAHQGSE